MRVRLVDRWRRPRAEVWILACLFLGGAAGSAIAATVRFHPDTAVELWRAYALVSLTLALFVLVAGHRLGANALQSLLAVATLLVGVRVYGSADVTAAMVSAYAYFWIGIYAAHFLSRRHALTHTLLMSATFALALQLRGHSAVLPWFAVTSSLVAAILVLGTVVQRLNAQATTDQLTGLLNRHGLREVAVREFAVAQRTGWPVSVALVDLDAFKAVNDAAGHAAGDRLLRDLAGVWKESMRASDVIAREGGDEFVLLLPATSTTEAHVLLDRLAERSPTPWSAGVTQWRPGEELDACLERADAALYEVKPQALEDPADGDADDDADDGVEREPRGSGRPRTAMRITKVLPRRRPVGTSRRSA